MSLCVVVASLVVAGGNAPGTVVGARDPMAAVNASVQFSSTGERVAGWYRLAADGQAARWEFSGLPSTTGDLSLEIEAKVPTTANATEFRLELGTGAGGSEQVLASGLVRLAASGGRASGELTIPAGVVPAGTSSLWVEASPGTVSGGAAPALRKSSVRLGRLSPAAAPAPDPGTAKVPPPPTSPPPTTEPPATTSPRRPVSFTSDGDLVSGWYWLRDPAGAQSARWELDVPQVEGSLRLDLEVLATTGPDGPPGQPASFHVAYGPVPDRRPESSVRTRTVTLPNVSPPGDPVGYTTRGSVDLSRTVLPVGTRRMWVRMTRKPVVPTVRDPNPPVSPGIVAVRAQSATVVSPDPKPPTTKMPPITGGPPPSSTTTSTPTTTTSTPTTTVQAAPVITAFSSDPSATVSCPSPSAVVPITLTWSTTNAFGVTIRIDSDAPESFGVSGSAAPPFDCAQASHEYVLTALGANNTRTSRWITLNRQTTTTTTRPGSDGGTTTGECVGGRTGADAFSPVETGARWWSDSTGTKWYAIRTLGDVLTGELPEEYTNPANQSATWRFTQLPRGTGDVTFDFVIPARGDGTTVLAPENRRFAVTYGPIPATGVRVTGSRSLHLTQESAVTGSSPMMVRTVRTGSAATASTDPYPETYAMYRGSVTVPRAAIDSGNSGYWLRVTPAYPQLVGATVPEGDLGYPGYEYSRLQALFNLGSVTFCTGSGTPIVHDAPLPSAMPTVSYNKASRRLTSSRRIFVDPATDPDGDGIDQEFEHLASIRVNPRIDVDEDERWLENQTTEPAVSLVRVAPYPSFQDTRYVVFAYLATFAYDAGLPGVELTDDPLNLGSLAPDLTDELGAPDALNTGYEIHRGDTEKVYEAYRVVDDRTLQLDYVFTSSHGADTNHDGLWAVTGSSCNTGNTYTIDLTASGSYSQSIVRDPMCATLEYTTEGQVKVAASQDKHAMYPTVGVCEAITLFQVRIPALSTMLTSNPLGSTLADLATALRLPSLTVADQLIPGLASVIGVSNYAFAPGPDNSTVIRVGEDCGDGGVHGLSVFNVGEPGNWLVNDLDEPTTWRIRGLQRTLLTGKYPNEAVWTGRSYVNTSYGYGGGLELSEPRAMTGFCGGLDTQMTQGNQTVTYTSGCSGVIGNKYTDFPPELRTKMLAVPAVQF